MQVRRLQDNCPRGRLPPNPNSNANPKPNPSPDQGGNFPWGQLPGYQ